MEIKWVLKKFEELSVFELYAILRLRNEVFVVEQNCVFQDADNYDPSCHHLMGITGNEIVAYARIVPSNIIYDEVSIGRVVTSPSVRRTSIGKQLMETAIDSVKKLYGNVDIRIGAQLYLEQFYNSFGFNRISDVYIEDGIPHIYMLRNNAYRRSTKQT